MLSRVARPFWSFAAMLPIAAFASGSCASDDEGRPDSELGNLVISPTAEVHKVNLDKAATDPDELLSAVLLPHSWLGERLGAHVIEGHSSVQVREGDLVVEDLDDTLRIDFDGEDRFTATLDNSKEYGRHAIFDGTKLYLRPRFGLYHARAPQTETEAGDIRSEMAGGAGDYLELLSAGLEVSDKGATTRDGRAVRDVVLKLAPTPRKRPAETLSQRLWRNSIEVESLSGLAALDVETGAVIYLQLEGGIAFERDGRRFHMRMKAERTISDIGHSRAVQAPPAEEVMEIGIRRRALDERDTLLRNIAPPARKSPTPSTSEEGSE